MSALLRLVRFIRENEIAILHAHAESLFIATLAALIPPYPMVVWHDHWGPGINERPVVLLYRLAATIASGVITVSEPLADWCRSRLHVPGERVWYLPNFVTAPRREKGCPALPGVIQDRIACVANLRPQKDHITLIRAMGLVVKEAPRIHLLLVGGGVDRAYRDEIVREISQQGLEGHVSLLGDRRDVNAILRACNLGILSSADEGLPLALLEYGLAGLPVVATNVGQCNEVLDRGRAGILVPHHSPARLANEVLGLLQSPERARQLGNKLRERVLKHYGPERILTQISCIYDELLRSEKRRVRATQE
jgi:glycosyltransferase involved in cell wall biosynthesis